MEKEYINLLVPVDKLNETVFEYHFLTFCSAQPSPCGPVLGDCRLPEELNKTVLPKSLQKIKC